ncbi:MAG: hypothetical protein B7Z66_07725 [Chromatiales bacterium 21-64-14]|nr:MAG: hypothetical protein B7Z66_07725 [Chromatiales bacterium 21-64-14]HQU15944.1 TonB family protein [Gammaproteobacteria bacterium]
MSEAVLLGPGAPDDPARRLAWVLAVAVLLVLLGLLGVGRLLKSPMMVPVAPTKPVEARIYELPAAPGGAPARPAAPAPVPPRPTVRRQPALPTAPPRTVPAQPRGTMPVPRAQRPPAPSHPPLNWATLRSQVADAVADATASRRSVLQIHDPHTLVAHYYIASVLRKLQAIGNLNYPGALTGVTVVRLIIDRQGGLVNLKLLHSSSNDALDHDAERIVRMSAPFAPFPTDLKRQTAHIELVIYMNFYGYRKLYTEY